MRALLTSLILCSVFHAFGQKEALEEAMQLESSGNLEESYLKYRAIADSYYSKNQFKEYVETHLKMIQLQIQLGKPFQARSLSVNTLGFIEKKLPSDSESIAVAKSLLGLSNLNLARNEEALDLLLEAEKLFSEDNAAKARCLDAIGLAYTNNENYQLAAQYLEQGLRLRRKLFGAQSVDVGNSYNNLGRVYAINDPLQAIIYFNRARDIYEKQLGATDKRTLRSKINIAFANREQGNFNDAIDLLEEVQTTYEQEFGRQNSNVAFVLSIIGRIQKDQEKYDEALYSQQEALQIYLDAYGEKHQEVANTYYLIGEIYLSKEEFKTSLSFYQKAVYANLPGQNPTDSYDLPSLTNYLNGDVLLTSLTGKALALEYLHYQKTLNVKDLVSAVDTYIKCDELITNIRRKRLNEQDKLRLGNVAKEVYENGIQLSLNLSEGSFSKKKYLERAFEFCERSKSSVLLEAITESKAKDFAGIPHDLLVLEDSLKDEISYLEQELASSEGEKPEAKDLLFSYQNSYRDFIGKLEIDYPNYYQLKYNQEIATVGDVQRKLSDRMALISYFIGSEEIFVFTITKKGIKAERKRKREEFDKLSIGLRNAIKYKIEKSLTKTSKTLYDQLIPKLPSTINQLVILPDGALGTIPFEALMDPNEDRNYLIQDFHISYDYAATLFIERKMDPQVDSPQILLVAPISFEYDDLKMNSLPGSEKEIEEIELLFKGMNCVPKTQVGSFASESNFKSEPLSAYQFVHFATHGLVNESEPALSRIFLSAGEGQDGSLYAGEIYNLDINADLVTLSACETGLGKIAKGEGIVGLSRALQYAGANNIIVSLWQVADESTAQMMIEFYKYNLYNVHHGYNAALRRAKLSLLNTADYSQPYYWAPFILVGM